MAVNNVIELEKVRNAKQDLIMQIAKRFAHNEEIIERMANKLAQSVLEQRVMKKIITWLIAINFIFGLTLAGTIGALVTHNHDVSNYISEVK